MVVRVTVRQTVSGKGSLPRRGAVFRAFQVEDLHLIVATEATHLAQLTEHVAQRERA